jgi:predicted HAD superfamily Cof-like phosphohydrolase
MKKQLEAVKQFHSTFGMGISETPKACLGEAVNLLRYNLMKEENEEYLKAVQNKDIVEIADALGDMLYILCGTIIEHGLQHKIEEVFDEIQRSNMSKLGADGRPIYREDGKVMKGPSYFKPDFTAILAETK